MLINIVSFIASPAFAAIITWLPVIFCLAIGVWWALATNDWENFSRMGSIIVIISLTTYFGNFEKKIKLGLEKMEISLGRIGKSIMEESIRVNSGVSTLSVVQREEINIAGSALGRDFVKLHLLITNMDSGKIDRFFSWNALAIAMLGTIIWGFGDLLNLI